MFESSVIRSDFAYDLMGRVTLQQDYGGLERAPGGLTYSRSVTYNAKGQVSSDDVSTRRDRNEVYTPGATIVSDVFRNVTTYGYGSGSTYHFGSVLTATVKAYKNDVDVVSAGSGAPDTLTQGIGRITGLQSKFDFAGVAASAVGAGVSHAISPTFGNSLPGRIASGTVAGIANAATRSALNGSSFGDNFRAAMPDIIGQAIAGAALEAVGGKGPAPAHTHPAMGNPFASDDPKHADDGAIRSTGTAIGLGITGSTASLVTGDAGGASATGGSGVDGPYDGPPIDVKADWHLHDHLPEMTGAQFTRYGNLVGDHTDLQYKIDVAHWAMDPRHDRTATPVVRAASAGPNVLPSYIPSYGMSAMFIRFSNWATEGIGGWRKDYNQWSRETSANLMPGQRGQLGMVNVAVGGLLGTANFLAAVPGMAADLPGTIGSVIGGGATLVEAAIIPDSRGRRVVNRLTNRAKQMDFTDWTMFAGEVGAAFVPAGALRFGRAGQAVAADGAAAIHPGRLAAEGAGVAPESVVRALRQAGTPESLATAKLISTGRLDMRMMAADPSGRGLGGLYRFGTREIELYSNAFATPRQAAGFATHETKHFMQGLTPRNYNLGHEFDAFRAQGRVDLGHWTNGLSDSGLYNTLQTHSVYRGVPADPRWPR